jgi:hypothetical protein
MPDDFKGAVFRKNRTLDYKLSIGQGRNKYHFYFWVILSAYQENTLKREKNVKLCPNLDIFGQKAKQFKLFIIISILDRIE